MKKNKKKQPTYTARYKDTGEIIYKNEPLGNLFGKLPLGSGINLKETDERRTKAMSDEEWWDGVEFITPSGREIIVKKD